VPDARNVGGAGGVGTRSRVLVSPQWGGRSAWASAARERRGSRQARVVHGRRGGADRHVAGAAGQTRGWCGAGGGMIASRGGAEVGGCAAGFSFVSPPPAAAAAARSAEVGGGGGDGGATSALDGGDVPVVVDVNGALAVVDALSPCVQPPAADLVLAVAADVHCPGVGDAYPAAFSADGPLRNASVEHEPASAATPPPTACPCHRLGACGGCGRRRPVGGAVLAERGSRTADAAAATAMSLERPARRAASATWAAGAASPTPVASGKACACHEGDVGEEDNCASAALNSGRKAAETVRRALLGLPSRSPAPASSISWPDVWSGSCC